MHARVRRRAHRLCRAASTYPVTEAAPDVTECPGGDRHPDYNQTGVELSATLQAMRRPAGRGRGPISEGISRGRDGGRSPPARSGTNW